MSWQEAYDAAITRLDAAAGYYNRNVRVDISSGPVNVRIPIPGADIMDLRMWPEAEVLSAIAPYVTNAPRLLHASTDPAFQVHEFIDGELLNHKTPRGVPVPAHVITDVVALLAQLTEVPAAKLPSVPTGWPTGRDTIGFARQLSALTARVYATHRDRYGPLYRAFGVPADPLAPVLDAWPRITARPLVCVHADVHRKNIIVTDGRSVFLDWELTLWGDPVYDLAVHLHKMGYLAHERDELLHRWIAIMPGELTTGWRRDLASYLAHEQIKSTLVDTVRYARLFIDPATAPEPEQELAAKLATKLNNAYRHWGVHRKIDQSTVEDTLRRWAAEHP